MVTHVQGAGSETPSGSSGAVTLNGITAGNLIVVFVRWESGDATPSVSDGTTTFTAGTKKFQSPLYGQYFYLLSANSGNKTITATMGATRDWIHVFAVEFHATGAWAFDTSAIDGGSGTTINSGNINTTGTEEVVFGMYGTGGVGTTSSEQINGVAATEDATYSPTGNSSVWYRILSATFSGGAASATVASQNWVCAVVAFKVPPAVTIPVLMHHYLHNMGW